MEREQITERAHGIDISHHQGEFVVDKTWGQLDFGISKIGEGYNTPYTPKVNGDFTDFLRLWDTGCARLDIRGVYFYQRSQSYYSWEKQASLVLDAIEKLSVKPHMIWLDVEKINNTINSTMLADMKRIMDYWKINSPYTVGLYTNKDVLQNYIQPIGLRYYGQQWLNQVYAYPLWYAQYWWMPSPNKQPGLPTFKPSWDIWQYSASGDSIQYIDGVKYRRYGSPDVNVYNGTVAEMKRWLKITDAPQPDLEEELFENWYWNMDPLGQYLPIKGKFNSTWKESAKVNRCGN